jgi:hypothetical protein
MANERSTQQDTVVERYHDALNNLLALVWRDVGDLHAGEAALAALAQRPDLPLTMAFADRVRSLASPPQQDAEPGEDPWEITDADEAVFQATLHEAVERIMATREPSPTSATREALETIRDRLRARTQREITREEVDRAYAQIFISDGPHILGILRFLERLGLTITDREDDDS